MNPKDYREQVVRSLRVTRNPRARQESFQDESAPSPVRQHALEGMGPIEDPDDLARVRQVASDRTADPALRAAAMSALGQTAAGTDDVIDLALERLADAGEPIAVRRAALGVLKLAALTTANLAARRADYLATLRMVIDTDDPDLREEVLGVLAREQDPVVQQRLIDGLADPAQALVAPEIAIPLLGYELKAEVYPHLREILEGPASLPARIEAVRLLAADTASRDVVEAVARDRAEPAALRQIATAALHAIDAGAARRIARDVVMDRTEAPEMQATGLTALAMRGAGGAEEAGEGDDDELLREVEHLAQTATSTALRQSARAYLSKRR